MKWAVLALMPPAAVGVYAFLLALAGRLRLQALTDEQVIDIDAAEQWLKSLPAEVTAQTGAWNAWLAVRELRRRRDSASP